MWIHFLAPLHTHTHWSPHTQAPMRICYWASEPAIMFLCCILRWSVIPALQNETINKASMRSPIIVPTYLELMWCALFYTVCVHVNVRRQLGVICNAVFYWRSWVLISDLRISPPQLRKSFSGAQDGLLTFKFSKWHQINMAALSNEFCCLLYKYLL